jgi:hypothetical protein
MRISITPWLETTDDISKTNAVELHRNRAIRTIDDICNDIFKFAVSQGYTENQARNAIESLFRTFSTQWFLYLICGADDIVTAIQNDATISWFNTQVGGQTIRQRLINRLS